MSIMDRRHVIAACLLLLTVMSAGVVSAQNVPSQMNTALQQLSSLVGQPVTLGDLDSYQWVQNVYPDTHLGCEFAVFPAQTGNFVGFEFDLIYNGIPYDIRVSGDSTIVFPCMAEGGMAPAPGIGGGVALSPCPTGYVGFLPPRLRVGGQASIDVGGTPNRLRAGDRLNATQIGMIEPGSIIDILAGPSCEANANGTNVIWWQVRYNGQIGWTAEGLPPDEYFLEPINTLGDVVLPAERGLITAQSLLGLQVLGTIGLQSAVDIDIADEVVVFGGYAGLAAYNLADFTLNETFFTFDTSMQVNSLAVSADGQYAAFGFCDGVVLLYNALLGGNASLETPPQDCVVDLDFSPDGSQLAVASGNLLGSGLGAYLSVYDGTTGDGLTQKPANYIVTRVTYNDDGTLLAYVDEVVHVMDATNFTDVRLLAFEAYNPIGDLRFMPTTTGNPRLLIPEGNTLRLIDLVTGSDVASYAIEGANLIPSDVSFSPDGSLLAVSVVINEGGSLDNPRVDIFSVETGDVIATIPVRANDLEFSPDGTLLMIAEEGFVSLYGIP